MQVNASQLYQVQYAQQTQSSQPAQAPQGDETGRVQGHHHHHHHGGGLGSMINGGEQGVADVKSQVSQLVQDVKAGKITEDQFKQQMTDLANKDLKTDLSPTDKARAIHTLARMANMEGRMQGAQSGSDAGQTQAQPDSLSQLLRSWAGGYAKDQGVSLAAAAGAAPQGALLDGRA